MAPDRPTANGAVRHLTPADYKITPWRNGGGRTTEIAVSPAGASLAEGFDWRLSVAEVERDGPFSSFPGCDRSLSLLSGGGILLDAGEEGDIELRQPYKPVSFPGEWEIEGRLLGAAIRDLNLIFARDRAAGRVGFLEVRAAPLDLESDAPVLLLHLVKGGPLKVNWDSGAESVVLRAEETLRLEDEGGHALELAAEDGAAQVAVVEISPKA
jgi:hypothetical protein